MQPALKVKRRQGSAIPELLKHGRNHHQPEPHRIPRDYKKCNLPRQPNADESIIKTRMRDRRRILPPDHIKHKVERGKYENAPDPGNQENHFAKFHVRVQRLRKKVCHSDCTEESACCPMHNRNLMIYSPPTVSPSTRIVGAATDPRNSRSFAISEILKYNSFRFPATVTSSTGYANSPPEIHIPEAPRE